MKDSGKRYIGLDVHNHYLIAVGVDADLKMVLRVRRVEFSFTWYILAKYKTDCFAEPQVIAQKYLKFAYQLGKENRPQGQSAAQFVRQRLDALQFGQNLTSIAWGSKKPIPLPPRPTK